MVEELYMLLKCDIVEMFCEVIVVPVAVVGKIRELAR